ncbi:MAG: hypothetical protein JNM64_03005, partial [Chloroflexia bacterium]|nr:hypothetical protein [Chloroflexia bacterium]
MIDQPTSTPENASPPERQSRARVSRRRVLQTGATLGAVALAGRGLPAVAQEATPAASTLVEGVDFLP